jgi:hypothetical protein
MISNLLNHPDIRPFMGGEGVLDAELLPPHVYLGDHRGGMLFIENMPNVYEGHYLFTRATRLREKIEIASSMIVKMLLEHEAELIWGQVPIANRKARWFTRQIGLSPLGFRQRPYPSEIFGVRREWVIQSEMSGQTRIGE